jgi:hypothetical protein
MADFQKLDSRYFTPRALAIKDELLSKICARNTHAELVTRFQNLNLGYIRDEAEKAIALGVEEYVLVLMKDMAVVAVKLEMIEDIKKRHGINRRK